MSNTLKNIHYMIGEHSIEFTYNDGEKAWLQLPDTGDSVHKINGIKKDNWTEREWQIFNQLTDYYFKSFNKNGANYAFASAEIGKTVVKLIKTVYRNRTVYVAIDDDNNTHVLVKNSFGNRYFNKDNLFRKVDPMTAFELFGDDYNETELINSALSGLGIILYCYQKSHIKRI
jgi:hypothetical protein